MQQDPSNSIQVNYKASPRNVDNLKWYNIIKLVPAEIIAFQKLWRRTPSSRSIAYQLADSKVIAGHEFNYFISATVTARLGDRNQDGELVYPKLDIDCFSDNSRKVVGRYNDDPPTDMEPPGEIEDPDDYIDYYIDQLKEAPKNYDGIAEAGEDGKPGGYWYNQPEYVELWEEKNDLLEPFEILAREKEIRMRASKGYGSLPWLNECATSLKELMESKQLEQEHVWILICGDRDPSGLDIIDYTRKRLRRLGLPNVNIVQVAVTEVQIKKYKLPIMSIGKAPDKTMPNPNLSEFERLHGKLATHLNAFLTPKHVKEFKKILHAAIDKHHDKAIYDKMLAEVKEADLSEELTSEELAETRTEMYQKITDTFKPGWEREYTDTNTDTDSTEGEDTNDE